jgi:hypothetical protein
MNMAEHVALAEKKSVAVFSMEMSGPQLAMRMIGSVGRVDQHELRTGTFKEDDWSRLVDAVGRLNEAQIYIDDTAGLNVLEVRSRARRLHRQCGGLALVVIDYLQLMSGTAGGREENRATEIAEISRSLKSLAKELKVPVIALSQLNRSVDARQDKRPMMSDLRESGAIEQDADLILFIYRDEVYNPDSPRKGISEIIIAASSRASRTTPVRTVSRSLAFHLRSGRRDPTRHSGQQVTLVISRSGYCGRTALIACDNLDELRFKPNTFPRLSTRKITVPRYHGERRSLGRSVQGDVLACGNRHRPHASQWETGRRESCFLLNARLCARRDIAPVPERPAFCRRSRSHP